jgi:hypothetical protein
MFVFYERSCPLMVAFVLGVRVWVRDF